MNTKLNPFKEKIKEIVYTAKPIINISQNKFDDMLKFIKDKYYITSLKLPKLFNLSEIDKKYSYIEPIIDERYKPLVAALHEYKFPVEFIFDEIAEKYKNKFPEMIYEILEEYKLFPDTVEKESGISKVYENNIISIIRTEEAEYKIIKLTSHSKGNTVTGAVLPDVKLDNSTIDTLMHAYNFNLKDIHIIQEMLHNIQNITHTTDIINKKIKYDGKLFDYLLRLRLKRSEKDKLIQNFFLSIIIQLPEIAKNKKIRKIIYKNDQAFPNLQKMIVKYQAREKALSNITIN